MCKFLHSQISSIDHITSMTCVAASGKVLLNFLIYAKSFPTVSIEENLPKSWIYAKSENGKIVVVFLFIYIHHKYIIIIISTISLFKKQLHEMY